MFLFVCYSITLNNTDIFTSSKGKTPTSTSSIEAYNKEALGDKIRKLTAANVQLVTDKIETEKVKVNLEADRTRLFNKKNFLVIKREELRTEIATLNTAGSSNVLVRRHQDPLLKPIQDKFKAKRSTLFDNIKKNF